MKCDRIFGFFLERSGDAAGGGIQLQPVGQPINREGHGPVSGGGNGIQKWRTRADAENLRSIDARGRTGFGRKRDKPGRGNWIGLRARCRSGGLRGQFSGGNRRQCQNGKRKQSATHVPMSLFVAISDHCIVRNNSFETRHSLPFPWPDSSPKKRLRGWSEYRSLSVAGNRIDHNPDFTQGDCIWPDAAMPRQ